MGQLAGFFLANLLGMLIVMLTIQVAADVMPALSGEDGIIKDTYVIVSKRIAATSTLSGEAQPFTDEDIAELKAQSFARRVGVFTASRYQVYASLAMGGLAVGTEMFFESVPDEFVDARWPAPRDGEVPIILPRDYLALYNFGFAQSKNLPRLSEGVISMIEMDIRLRGRNGEVQQLRGRVVGFSTRLNTVLVPESFMQQTNATLAPNTPSAPTRLIVEVANPTDDAIAKYMSSKNYEVADESLNAGRAAYLVKVIAAIVVAVGLLISLLSFYILMLSIFLLVQKNAEKMQNLLLIGYPPSRVALPYQLLAGGLSLAVLLLAMALLFVIRNIYMERLWQMFPTMSEGSTAPTLLVGFALCLIVTICAAVAIGRKIRNI